MCVCVCVCQGKSEEGGNRQQRRENWDKRESEKEGERVEPQNNAAASSCGTPRFPPDCFQLVLEPWAFWVLEASPDPTIPPAPHPAA